MSDELEDAGGPEPGDEPVELESSEPEPILGKFKTQDELVRAYQEAQAELTRKSQKLSEMEREPAYQQPAPVQDEDEWATKFYDDPKGVVMNNVLGVISQYDQLTRKARSETKKAIAERKGDPMFKYIGDQFEAELEGVDPSWLAGPQAKAVADDIYKKVAGDYALRTAKAAQSNPKERMSLMESLGVSEPQASPSQPDGELPSRSQLDAIKSGLGLGDDAAKRALSRALKEDQ